MQNAVRCFHHLWQATENDRRFRLQRLAAGRCTAYRKVTESKEDCPLPETNCAAIDGLPCGIDAHLGGNTPICKVG